MISSVKQVIDTFGGPAAYARHVGMTPGAAKQARRRNSLNIRWIRPTAEAAERLGFPITENLLHDIAAERAGRPAPSDSQQSAA